MMPSEGAYSNVPSQHHQADPSVMLFDFLSYRGVCCVQIDKLSSHGVHCKCKNNFSVIYIKYS